MGATSSFYQERITFAEPKIRVMKARKKNTAALLALFLGAFGVHRFYLGQIFLGVVYAIFLATGISVILSIIDAIILFSMSEDTFDAKYNDESNIAQRRRRSRKHRRRERRDERYDDRVKRRHQVKTERVSNRVLTSRAEKKVKFKKLYAQGQKLFKEYQFNDAEKAYLEALALAPSHPKLLFDIACLYSMKEMATTGFEYLELAVHKGYDKFEEIENNPSLAYLRIQDEFLDFAKAGYKRINPEESLSPEMLEKLRQLDILKSRGLLTEMEFEDERRKIIF